MSSTYSTNLAIELIGTGDQAGTWGNTTNSNLGTLIEQSISGYVTQAVSTGTDTTITIPNGTSGVARNMYIELTGTGGASTNLIVPANKKLYFIFNNSTGAVTVKVTGQTGVSVPTGKKMVLVSNGTDIVNGLNFIADFATNSFSVTNLTATSASITTLTGTSANITTLSGTTATFTSATVTNLALTSLTISNLSIASANITTLTGSTQTLSGNLTLSGGNLAFTSTAQRITGDMSNATLTNRLAFQSSTTNGNTTFIVLPNGTSTTSQFLAFNTADPTNSSNAGLVVTSTAIRLSSGQSGTGSYLPLTFFTSGAEQARLDTSGNLGIGTTTPAAKLNVDAGSAGLMSVFDSTNANGGYLLGRSSGTAVWDLGTAKQALNVGGATDFGINVRSGFIALGTGNTERMRLDSSGNLGIGTASPAERLHVVSGANTTQIRFGDNTNCNGFLGSRTGNLATLHTDQILAFGTGNSTFTERMRLDTSGNLGIGTTSPGATLDVAGNARSNAWIGRANGSAPTADAAIYRPADNTLGFSTNNTERARITSGGDFVVGKTTAVIGTAGGYITGLGEAVFTVAGNPVLYVNRLTDDGDLVRFYQADTQEGSISVSGNTVSYNAFAGSHWSQLQDGSKPDILRGTVMESINELCVWPDEQNERLPKSKVSDTAGSKKVYGVFMAWDNDWATTNDMYITAVGAFICRVNASVTVQEGDLLESNGDGTARVQADDIIRSSTIGKVTSTVKTHQYADGSYCVPTVLYCG